MFLVYGCVDASARKTARKLETGLVNMIFKAKISG